MPAIFAEYCINIYMRKETLASSRNFKLFEVVDLSQRFASEVISKNCQCYHKGNIHRYHYSSSMLVVHIEVIFYGAAWKHYCAPLVNLAPLW